MPQHFSTWEGAVTWLRQQEDQAYLVRSCYYDDPLLGAADRYAHSEEWISIKNIISGRSGEALDIGAGRGIASYALAKEGWNVTALEPDPSDLVGAGAIRRLAAEGKVSITVEQRWGESLPFADATFDLVFARAVLHHAKDLDQFCKEIWRVLKPHGLLIAAREHVISSKADLPKFFAIHPLHRLYGGENAYVVGGYRRALAGAGLSLVREIRPFEDPINYAPILRDELRGHLMKYARTIPVAGALIAGCLRIPGMFWLFLKIIDHVDRRPGRLYTFLCTKKTI